MRAISWISEPSEDRTDANGVARRRGPVLCASSIFGKISRRADLEPREPRISGAPSSPQIRVTMPRPAIGYLPKGTYWSLHGKITTSVSANQRDTGAVMADDTLIEISTGGQVSLNPVIRLWPDGPPCSLPGVGSEITFPTPPLFGPHTAMLRNLS